MATSFHLDSVFVVQSLAPDEEPTGRKLFDGTLAKACSARGFLAEIFEETTRDRFFGCLEHVARVAEEHSRAPLLHLETHGGPEGLTVGGPNGELVRWAELVPHFQRINNASRMNFVVIAAMCHGIHMVDLLKPHERAPAFAILGATRAIAPEMLLEAMRVFYWRLLGPEIDLSGALEELWNAGGSASFDLQTAEGWMCQVFRSYFAEVYAEETREQRVARLHYQLLGGAVPDVLQSLALRTSLAADLDNHEFWFGHYRQRFLMLDLFSGNESRFPLRLGDCKASA